MGSAESSRDGSDCMRVLQVSKTSEGAFWAVRQVAELVRSGVEVHVALPERAGAASRAWPETGAKLPFLDCSLPGGNPGDLMRRIRAIRRRTSEIAPARIPSHFASKTLMLPLALGRPHSIPRIF